VPLAGYEAHSKDLESLVNIPSPTSLRFMKSFFGRLNCYIRIFEDFAFFASVLYDLREAEFFAIN
jgi:hypothetical protein